MQDENKPTRPKAPPSNLSLAMYRTGVTHQQVAESAGTTTAHVTNVLAGRDTSSRVVISLAHLLNKSERWILSEIRKRRPNPRRRRNPAPADTRPAAVRECDAALEHADQE